MKRAEVRQAFVASFLKVMDLQYDNVLVIPLESPHPDISVIKKKMRSDFDINLRALTIALQITAEHPDLEDDPK